MNAPRADWIAPGLNWENSRPVRGRSAVADVVADDACRATDGCARDEIATKGACTDATDGRTCNAALEIGITAGR